VGIDAGGFARPAPLRGVKPDTLGSPESGARGYRRGSLERFKMIAAFAHTRLVSIALCVRCGDGHTRDRGNGES
jgi:hypothetical protein